MPTTRAPRNFQVLVVRRRGFSVERAPANAALAIAGNRPSITSDDLDSSITPSLEPSTTSGPAPLAVFFDAVGTTHPTLDAFRELGYSFNFGDSNAGTWTYSSESKNVERGGPLAAHVYETPGTYTAKLGVYDPNTGEFAQTSVTITVTDPDEVFAGTSTVCLSLTSDFTGAPTGADQQTITSWPTFVSGRRYLLRAGQDFSSLGDIHIKQKSDIQFGKFGSGAKPLVSAAYLENGNPSRTNSLNYPGGVSASTWSTRITFMDMESTGTDSGSVAGSRNSASHVLYLRFKSGNGFAVSSTVGYYGNPANDVNSGMTDVIRQELRWGTNFFFVDCESLDTVTALNNPVNIRGIARNLAILGCRCDFPTEHNIRIFAAYKALIAHSRCTHFSSVTKTGKHAIKFHSDGSDAWDDNPMNVLRPATRYVRIARNHLGDDVAGVHDANQLTQLGPQQASNVSEGCEDYIIENNVAQTSYQSESEMDGRRMTERGNTINGGGSWNVNTSTEKADGLPGDAGGLWDGPYYTGLATIATQDPT